MVKTIIALVIIAIGCIATAFFAFYKGTIIPYPYAFMLLSIGVVWGTTKWMSMSAKAELKKVTDELNERISELKENGEQIPVDLSKCEVVGQTYTEEKEAYDGPRRYGPPDTIHVPEGSHVTSTRREGMSVVKEIETSESAVIYETEYRGKKRSFRSFALHHDRITVLFKLDAQKTTTIYVDRSDPERYYFDLEFLDQ